MNDFKMQQYDMNLQRKDKYLPFKVSQIKFLTDKTVETNALLVTGSCLEEQNRVALWGYDFGPELVPSGKLQPHCECDPDCMPLLGDSIDEPHLLSSVPHLGDVQAMRCLTSREKLIFVAGSEGNLSVLGLGQEYRGDNLEELQSLKLQSITKPNFSPFMPQRVPISALDVSEDGGSIYLATDDGQLLVVSTERLPKLAGVSGIGLVTGKGMDWCAVTTLERIDSNCIATANQVGQLKLWDMRRNGFLMPESRMLRPGSSKAFLCIASHPGQPNLIAVGGEGGGKSEVPVYMWDTRATKYPLIEMPCPGECALSLQFHPTQPDILYIGTEAAGLIKVTCRAGSAQPEGLATTWKQESIRMNVGGGHCVLKVEAALPGLEIDYGRSVHTLDVTNSCIACCSDDNSILQTIPCNEVALA
ncbi:Nucleoporin Nup43 [Cichlidogyrus casuarinus]|uniref:Nucleoporin Nup43 n=1 Tax=Cichlidogyrus casuarinus TaxID=1844966 RepID=A0ABD2QM75_9PLAT